MDWWIVKRTFKKVKLANEGHYYLSLLFLNSQPDKIGLSLAHNLFNCPSLKAQPSPFITKIEIEPEIQNRLPTLKSADTISIRTDKEETWDKKESGIARNDHPRSYNVLNEKDNLIIRNRHHIIPTNEKFIVRHDYEYIKKPSETILRKTIVPLRTDIPSNIPAPSARAKSRRKGKETKEVFGGMLSR